MQRQIRRVGLVLMVAFLAVFAQLNYVQIFAARSIAGNNANIRSLLREYSIERGSILTLSGDVIAESKATEDDLKYLRLYPEGDLYGHITGYYSLVFGNDRLERTYNDELLGEGGVISMQDIEDRFLGQGESGDDVRTTIVPELQRAARDTLGDQRGAVVALDPRTGEVRALWSNPSFDPNPLTTHKPKQIRAAWKSLNPESRTSPLANIATSRGYPPGSTFKVVTAAAALDSGRFSPNSTFPDPLALELPQTNQTLQNFSKSTCVGGGGIDLFTALQVSCDTTFAILGLRLHDEIESTAEALGFNQRIPFDLNTEASGFPHVPDDRQPFRAFAGIGQGDVVATPLQMALVAAAVANGGSVPQPRLVREVIDASGAIVARPEPQTLAEAMSPQTASELTRMMVAVVDAGTGTAAQIPGIKVAGKTGTAQSVTGAAPHAWFISFAPADNPRLAVAVIVENGGSFGSEATGGAVAAPIAKRLFEIDRGLRGW